MTDTPTAEVILPLDYVVTKLRESDEWDDTKAVLTTRCPKCSQLWSREVWLSLSIVGDALAICHDCGGQGSIMTIGNSRLWAHATDVPVSSNEDSVELTMEKVLDGYPLLYHFAHGDAQTFRERLNPEARTSE